MLFKKGIEPIWEDPANASGGILNIQIEDLEDEASIDLIWKNLTFALIGNTFPYSEHVNGFRFLDRLKKFKLIKLEVWLDVGLAK